MGNFWIGLLVYGILAVIMVTLFFYDYLVSLKHEVKAMF
jgi:hypothetical protein